MPELLLLSLTDSPVQAPGDCSSWCVQCNITTTNNNKSDKLTVHSVGLDELDPDTAITLPSGAVVTLSAGGTFTCDTNHVFDSLKEDEMGTDTFPYSPCTPIRILL